MSVPSTLRTLFTTQQLCGDLMLTLMLVELLLDGRIRFLLISKGVSTTEELRLADFALAL